MPIEHINKTDTLNEGREKLNAAIDGANAADVTSKAADTKATQALTNSESTQTQLDTIVIDGDSSVEAAQARVDEKGVPHPTLKARIDDGLNSVNQQLAQITFQIHSNGEDDTEQIQNAYNSLGEGGKLTIMNDCLITNLIFDKPNTQIETRGELIQKESASGTAITLGSLNVVKDIRAYISVSKENLGSMTHWGNGHTIGIKLLNVQNSNLNLNAKGFEKGIFLEATEGQGTAYNNITLTEVTNNKYNLSANVLNGGWVNENKYYGGRFTWDNRFASVPDKKHIYFPDSQMNQNIFFSPSLEGNGGTYIEINGFHNAVNNPRFETFAPETTVYINLGVDSLYNVIFYPYGNDLNETNYINKGLRNVVYFRDLIDSESTIKASNGVFHGRPNRYGTTGYGTVDSANLGSANNPVFIGRDSTLNITSKIDGWGNGEFNEIKTNKHTIQPTTENAQVVEEVLDYNGNVIKRIFSNGALYGKMTVASDYMENYFVPFSVKNTVGSPTGSPDGKVGVGVINTADSKIYFHVGGGVWKSVDLT